MTLLYFSLWPSLFIIFQSDITLHFYHFRECRQNASSFPKVFFFLLQLLHLIKMLKGEGAKPSSNFEGDGD